MFRESRCARFPILLNANAVLVGVVGFEPTPNLAISTTYSALSGAREARDAAVQNPACVVLRALRQRTRESNARTR